MFNTALTFVTRTDWGALAAWLVATLALLLWLLRQGPRHSFLGRRIWVLLPRSLVRKLTLVVLLSIGVVLSLYGASIVLTYEGVLSFFGAALAVFGFQLFQATSEWKREAPGTKSPPPSPRALGTEGSSSPRRRLPTNDA